MSRCIVIFHLPVAIDADTVFDAHEWAERTLQHLQEQLSTNDWLAPGPGFTPRGPAGNLHAEIMVECDQPHPTSPSDHDLSVTWSGPAYVFLPGQEPQP